MLCAALWPLSEPVSMTTGTLAAVNLIAADLHIVCSWRSTGGTHPCGEHQQLISRNQTSTHSSPGLPGLYWLIPISLRRAVLPLSLDECSAMGLVA